MFYLFLFFPLALFAQTLSIINVEDDSFQNQKKQSIFFAEKKANTDQVFILNAIDNNSSIHTSKNGGYSGNTSLLLRGMPSDSTSVYFGDIRLSDPSAFNRTSDPSFLSSDFASSVEVLKGSQGVLYGSDATAGVVRITPSMPSTSGSEASYKIGSFQSQKTSIETSKVSKTSAYQVSLSHFISDGFSNVGDGKNGEADSIENLSGYLNLQNEYTPNFEHELYIVSSKSTFDQDNFWSPNIVIDDENYRGEKQESMASNSFNIKTSRENKFKIKTQYYQVLRRDQDDVDKYTFARVDDIFRGENLNIAVENEIKFSNYEALIAVSHLQEKALVKSSFANFTERADQDSIYTNHKIGLNKLKLELGGRLSNHNAFGTQLSSTIGTKIEILTNTFALVRYGEGFKNPTLWELYHPVNGEKGLNPEKSQSYDLGFEYVRGENIKAQLIYFQQRLEDRVGYNSATKKFYQDNTDVSSEGVEVGLNINNQKNFSYDLSYTHTDSKTEGVGQSLKVPKNKLASTIGWAPVGNLKFHLRGKLVSSTYDFGNQKLGSYYLFDTGFETQASKELKLSMSVENIFNREYETSYGYNTFPLTVQAGMSLVF